MSRLHDLIEQAKASNPELGNALAEEVQRLEDRPTFGLVFERHAPEATELYGRPIAPGDKVHLLNERGSTAKADQTLWRVEDIRKGDAGGSHAHLVETLPGSQEWDTHAIGREPQVETALVENLVVVAEHTDTIYPGLVETGRVGNGPEDAPAHTIINAENLHALQALTYTHRHSIDCIYIDPPYNTGAKDWKYNNDYVEVDDDYRHSKWLSFMEKRLLLAKELLNPDDSVLIATIDEKEYLRLGLLLNQVFPEARIQMVSSVISSKGSARAGEFSRSDEYLFFVMFGSASPQHWTDDMLTRKECGDAAESKSEPDEVEWGRLKRNCKNGRRARAKSGFYPIYLNSVDGSFHSVGVPLPTTQDWRSVDSPEGTTAVWPIQARGEEQSWGIAADKIPHYVENGFIKFGKLFHDKPNQKAMVYYLTDGYLAAAASGEIENVGTSASPRWIHRESKLKRPFTVWYRAAHDAGWHGTRLFNMFLPNIDFDYAKSLYAVEDAIRFFVKNKPNAVILDFFAGSGTTAHAVMRLNKQDGGKRRSIMVTNNEVSAEEQKALREKGLRPGDPEWEALGIADYVTKPRVTAAITGRTPDGDPVKGNYKFTDEFPMSDGFEANARYFSLEYLNPVMVEYGYAFSRIAPLLWMRAGQVGPVIEELSDRGWEVTDFYAVIENCDEAPAFIEAVKQRPGITHVYIITDNASVYRRVARGLDDSVQAIQLYESYLTNFAINASRVLK